MLNIIWGWKGICAYVGYSRNTIRKYAREKGFQLRQLTPGGMFHILKEEADEWLKADSKNHIRLSID